MDLIYLDNNATTTLLPAVWDAMRPFALDAYGNPASAHQAGRARAGVWKMLASASPRCSALTPTK